MHTRFYCELCLSSFLADRPRCANLGCGAERPPDGWGSILQPGDVLDRHYLIERALAIGGAGITYLAQALDETNAPSGPALAIKVLYPHHQSSSLLRRLATEAQILRQLDHPNVVECLGFVQRSGAPPYLITRFERGGNLQEQITHTGPVPPRTALGILRQIVCALQQAHRHGVIHRDLKPENVLLTGQVDSDNVPTIRVTDFGIAKVLGGPISNLTQTGTFLGTPEYSAPEQFERLQPTPAADIYATGAILHFLRTGKSPVQLTNRHSAAETLAQIRAAQPPTLPSPDLQRLLADMMKEHPEDRPDIDALLERIDRLLSAPINGSPSLEAAMALPEPMPSSDISYAALVHNQPEVTSDHPVASPEATASSEPLDEDSPADPTPVPLPPPATDATPPSVERLAPEPFEHPDSELLEESPHSEPLAETPDPEPFEERPDSATSPLVLGAAGFGSFVFMAGSGLMIIALLAVGALLLQNLEDAEPDAPARALNPKHPEAIAIHSSLQKAVQEPCSLRQPVELEVELAESGAIRRLVVEDGALTQDALSCLTDRLRAHTAPRESTGTVTVEVVLGLSETP